MERMALVVVVKEDRGLDPFLQTMDVISFQKACTPYDTVLVSLVNSCPAVPTKLLIFTHHRTARVTLPGFLRFGSCHTPLLNRFL